MSWRISVPTGVARCWCALIRSCAATDRLRTGWHCTGVAGLLLLLPNAPASHAATIRAHYRVTTRRAVTLAGSEKLSVSVNITSAAEIQNGAPRVM